MGAAGSTPASVSKRTTWPYVGEHLDRLRIHADDERYLSVYFEPRCPRCRRTKHPNVTRSHYWPKGDPPSDRHCNRCKIRWKNPEPQPFCSCHGDPADVLEKLFYGIYGKAHPSKDGWKIAK